MLTTLTRARQRLPLATRSNRLELLDLGRVGPVELETNLSDLARLNRLPGGTDASAGAIAGLLGDRFGGRILDVGSGAGDMPLAFADRGWTVVGLDASHDVVRVARRVTERSKRVRIVAGDARDLAFNDDAFDVAHCSLLLHHLDPPGAVVTLRELARVARLGVVINDLRRGWLPLLATGTAVALFGRCRATRHDGVLSVRRAYTPAELDELLAAAGLRRVRRSAASMPRVVTVAVRGAES